MLFGAFFAATFLNGAAAVFGLNGAAVLAALGLNDAGLADAALNGAGFEAAGLNGAGFADALTVLNGAVGAAAGAVRGCWALGKASAGFRRFVAGGCVFDVPSLFPAPGYSRFLWI